MNIEQIMRLARVASDTERQWYLGKTTVHAVRDAYAALESALREALAPQPQVVAALREFDALIKYQYSGSSEAMSALHYAAQAGKAALDGYDAQHVAVQPPSEAKK